MASRARHTCLSVVGAACATLLAACANDYTCADYATCDYDAGPDSSVDAGGAGDAGEASVDARD